MWGNPRKKDLEQMESAYKQNLGVESENPLILGHFFLGKNDWYIAEYNSKKEIMYGFIIPNGYHQFAEWGSVRYQGSKDSLMEMRIEFIHVVFDRIFRPIQLSDLKKQLDRDRQNA